MLVFLGVSSFFFFVCWFGCFVCAVDISYLCMFVGLVIAQMDRVAMPIVRRELVRTQEQTSE